MDRQKFSDRLKKLRIDKSLSLAEIADKLDIAKQSVHSWESMKTSPSFDRLIDLSSLLGVSIDYLTGKTDEYGYSLEFQKKVAEIASSTEGLLEHGFVEIRDDYPRIFSERFAAQRRQKKCGLYEIANAVNITIKELESLEKGEREPSFGELIEIARYFNVSLDYLVGRTEEYPTRMRYDDGDNFVLVKVETKYTDGLIFSGKIEPKLYNYNTGDILNDYEKAIKIASFIKEVARVLWVSVDFSNNDIRDAIYKYEATMSPEKDLKNWFDRFMGTPRGSGGIIRIHP